VFTNYDNSIKFISSYYYNSQQPTSSLIFVNGLTWKGQTIDTLAKQMVAVYTRFWPAERFANETDAVKWFSGNTQSTEILVKQAEEVLHLCEVYGLFKV